MSAARTLSLVLGGCVLALIINAVARRPADPDHAARTARSPASPTSSTTMSTNPSTARAPGFWPVSSRDGASPITPASLWPPPTPPDAADAGVRSAWGSALLALGPDTPLDTTLATAAPTTPADPADPANTAPGTGPRLTLRELPAYLRSRDAVLDGALLDEQARALILWGVDAGGEDLLLVAAVPPPPEDPARDPDTLREFLERWSRRDPGTDLNADTAVDAADLQRALAPAD